MQRNFFQVMILKRIEAISVHYTHRLHLFVLAASVLYPESTVASELAERFIEIIILSRIQGIVSKDYCKLH